MMRSILIFIIVVFLCVILWGSDELAFSEDRLNHLTITHGTWADTNFPDLPGKLLTGSLDFEESYYIGLTYARTLVDDFTIPIPYTTIRFEGWDLELEGSVLKHYNIQSHWEVASAFMLRTRQFTPLDFLGWTFAGGFGFSYAFEEPALEQGPDGIRGEDSEHFQSHFVIEWALFYPPYDRLHLIARVHHRSGMYGLITPRKTGSNFLAVGIRLDF